MVAYSWVLPLHCSFWVFVFFSYGFFAVSSLCLCPYSSLFFAKLCTCPTSLTLRGTQLVSQDSIVFRGMAIIPIDHTIHPYLLQGELIAFLHYMTIRLIKQLYTSFRMVSLLVVREEYTHHIEIGGSKNSTFPHPSPSPLGQARISSGFFSPVSCFCFESLALPFSV